MIEERTTCRKADGSAVLSDYKRDRMASLPHLMNENAALGRLDKKSFMERSGLFAIICIDKNSRELLSHQLEVRPVEYEGKFLRLLKFEIDNDALLVRQVFNQAVTGSKDLKGIIRD